MPADEHVEPGRVAAPDLEAVERGERDVDRHVGVDRRFGSRGERRDRLGGPETVVANGPHRVAGPDQRRVDELDLGRRPSRPRRRGRGLPRSRRAASRSRRAAARARPPRWLRRAAPEPRVRRAARRRRPPRTWRRGRDVPRWRHSSRGRRARSPDPRPAPWGLEACARARRLTTPTMPHIGR